MARSRICLLWAGWGYRQYGRENYLTCFLHEDSLDHAAVFVKAVEAVESLPAEGDLMLILARGRGLGRRLSG